MLYFVTHCPSLPYQFLSGPNCFLRNIMRRPILTFLFFCMTSSGIALCIETSPDEIVVIPVNVKDQALEKTLEYGQELCLRQDFGQATKLYEHVLTLDPCNSEARETLATIAKKGPATKDINDFLNGLKCELPPPPAPETLTTTAPAPSKDMAFAPKITSPVNATSGFTQHTPFQDATLQEKIADLQKRTQRIENAAQAQNTRLDKLNNTQPVTQNQSL
jgi:hypothetical protein